MQNTTLCYLERGGKVLMLHRVKKENDLNEGKWIGVGGHIEENESPEEGAVREIREETGLTPVNLRCRAVITFVSDKWEGEYMHLFTAEAPEGELCDCDEGVLKWVEKEHIFDLPMWEGDRIFLRLLAGDAPFFSLKLRYTGDVLSEAVLNGRPLPV